MKKIIKTAVLGAGGWGIALSKLLNANGCPVCLWEFDSIACAKLTQLREEPIKLPGIKIPETIEITNTLSHALKNASLVVFAVPVQVVRSSVKMTFGMDFSETIIVNVAKGIENKSLNRVSQILNEENSSISGNNYVVLSGPSHAEEVSRNIPTTLVAASENQEAAENVQALFSCGTVRVYTNSDVIGVELAGALKNIIALAAGVCDGLGFGDNTKGALLTRGMVEITRLGLSLGALRETFFGLSGMGDLITTCTSKHSRNRRVGELLGKGEKLSHILQNLGMVAEGVPTTQSAYHLALKQGIQMPITEEMFKILFEEKEAKTAVKNLMERDLKSEGI
ncbi:MAG: glycerol-3-phosphate dehydrogenase [Candidatus Raymondbacteria bacterium RifOxyA12_full_50_37]|uniref:Glycerol-3-phosphate dehydrogenase [NAD(P)+] n=1 Tax=Candidatus Raymondbacteria bacterium RIFOXYD12_FULL_49_13 TaxID=1817890 RepID=A0A1F7F1H7_UNCRA|nr:MAG: glycerol-3-phosphate dehydrogenase [Candidatus Raymondbacteria bacterium RifOxyA12_full_50_37]OGJ93142.1 MAG: glycerol-3-phosphate dehydrogenase [Candidatus Raymondbacteria bacterium RifOxyB12_full_50_8]OGJ93906.1 MAG: glycerol-3-phosphate dehydrogenase [Candidatus Raymondbacteria bacterium RIFOXYA2_FULL_49_16]OGJ98225.1 MAG: glycerol-3-phosphate dehydrogenase [Candidatus Raymondbacteria bacterium RIFOXYC2_FULL_50_21]OGK00458.1 MAG: glycerol-3-phosphate dehydrogenase [Candidatus Raymond